MTTDIGYIVFLFIFIFGTFIGSFLNVVIWRLPKGKKLTGRSECPNCKHQLNWLDLIPVVSFLISGAKCRYCSKSISWRYPLIELFTGVLFVLAVLLVSPGMDLHNIQPGPVSWLIADWVDVVKYLFILSVLFVVFVIDLEHYLILDKIVFPALVVVLVLNFLVSMIIGETLLDYLPHLIDSLMGMAAGFLPFFLLWWLSKGKWMGLGDAKFGLLLGAIFGFPQIWVCFFIAFLLGTVVAIPLLLTGKKELSSKLPFGTFLAVSAVITLWYGWPLAWWYYGLIGLN